MSVRAINDQVETAISAFQQGKMVILVDDESRENEGDLILAGDFITPEAINFMSIHGRGLICVAMAPEMLAKFQLPAMAKNNTSRFHTAFTVSVEAAQGVSTGISAADRAKTIQVLMSQNSAAEDIVTPGHVFPIQAQPGGVLVRRGQTEGSVDLAKLAGLSPGAVICEVMNEDGTMARMPELEVFSKQHDIPILTIEALANYRAATECLVEELSQARLPLAENGDFTIRVFKDMIDGGEHVAITKGDVSQQKTHLVRIHSECFTGDLLGSMRCDCGEQFSRSLAMIAEQGGVLLYLRQEGRGIGLANKINAYQLQDEGYDTVEANHQLGFGADQRDYRVSAHMLKHMGVTDIELLTNNPAKLADLELYGVKVHERIPLETLPNQENLQYLETKRDKMGHLLSLVEEA